MVHSSINVYLIDELLKLLLIVTPIIFGSDFIIVTTVSTCKVHHVGCHYMYGEKFQGLVMYQCISTGLKQCELSNKPLV